MSSLFYMPDQIDKSQPQNLQLNHAEQDKK